MIFRTLPMKHKLSNMEYLVSCVAFALLFLAHNIPSATAAGTVKPNYDFDNYKVFEMRGSLVLSCNVTYPTDYTLEWLKNDAPVVEDSLHHVLKDENKYIIDRCVDGDAGTYTCQVLGDKNTAGTIEVISKPTAKLPENTGVVEGEKLRLHCITQGTPKPTVEWLIGNETYTESRDRITLSKDESDVNNAMLLISEVSLDDRGLYTCRATSIATTKFNATEDSTFVRVKDKLAALWPFLGICAEVFVLCAIILLYEKRRTKPEMDESDTDQSPDQKKG